MNQGLKTMLLGIEVTLIGGILIADPGIFLYKIDQYLVMLGILLFGIGFGIKSR
jgi:hypothetical protein